jgi:hypothetical protein
MYWQPPGCPGKQKGILNTYARKRSRTVRSKYLIAGNKIKIVGHCDELLKYKKKGCRKAALFYNLINKLQKIKDAVTLFYDSVEVVRQVA